MCINTQKGSTYLIMARFNIITKCTVENHHRTLLCGKSILCQKPIQKTLEAITAGIKENFKDIAQMLKSGDTPLIEEYIVSEFFGVDISKYDNGEDYAEDGSTVVLDYCTKTTSMARRFTYCGEVEKAVGFIDITAAVDSRSPHDIAIGSVAI